MSPQAQAQSHVRLVNADQNQDIDIEGGMDANDPSRQRGLSPGAVQG